MIAHHVAGNSNIGRIRSLGRTTGTAPRLGDTTGDYSAMAPVADREAAKRSTVGVGRTTG